MEAEISIIPPAGAAKLEFCDSMRPEVHAPLESSAVMSRWPLPSRWTFEVELDIVSTSPVPQLAGPPGALVPVSSIQSDEEGAVPAAPPRFAFQTVFQFSGGIVVGPEDGVDVGVEVGEDEAADPA
jgi:hypothetical protein